MIEQLKPGKDYIGVGVFALIKNPGGEILLCKSVKTEKKGEEYEKVWSMIGGTVNFGETLQDALIREIMEETNLPVTIDKFLGYNEYIQEGKHWVAFNFLVHADTNVFINIEPEKQADLQWFPPNEIPQNISDYTKKSLEYLPQS